MPSFREGKLPFASVRSASDRKNRDHRGLRRGQAHKLISCFPFANLGNHFRSPMRRNTSPLVILERGHPNALRTHA